MRSKSSAIASGAAGAAPLREGGLELVNVHCEQARSLWAEHVRLEAVANEQNLVPAQGRGLLQTS
jgi:hypothetical protein